MAERFYLNENWFFTPNFSDELIKQNSDINAVRESLNMEAVSLPHSVCETPFDYFDEGIYQMISGYQRTIHVPEEFAGKRMVLVFEGAAHDSVVYINGIEKAVHHCGYTAFEVDITKEAIPGNDLSVVVKLNSMENLNTPPFGYVIDYMTYGGIYRDVYLEVSDTHYINDVFLYTEFEGDSVFLCAEVDVRNSSSMKLLLSVNGQEFESVISDGDSVVKLRNKVSYVTLWDIDNPVLYTVSTKLSDHAGTVYDEKTYRHGFRKAEFKEDGFYLNERKVKLRGLNRHQSFAYVGYALPASMQKEDARLLKEELACNAVRTSHYPQSHDFYDACDELGLLVFTEIPGWQHIGNAEWKEQAVENTRDMVLQYRNHVSVILWGVRINESVDDDEFYKRTNEVARSLDPTRATGGVRAHKKSSLFEDVYTYNDFVHDGSNIGCEDKKAVTSDVKKPYLVSEYNGHMYPTKAFDFEEHRREHAIRHANVLDAVAGKEDIAGSFGWCMFDYNTHKDFGAGDRICYHGVMDMFRNRKAAAYIYSAEGDKEDVLYVTSSMDIGEHPGCNRGAVYIISNADSVRMYKNGELLKEYYPSDSPYKNLKHGPILVDDFVGDAIEKNENYSKRLSSDIKKMMNATALYGLSKLPKSIMLLAAKAMIIDHMTMKDAVRLYNKYIGDWGGTSTVYSFEAIKDGKVVKTLKKEPMKSVKLTAKASTEVLKNGKTYDVALVRIEAVDQNENTLAFFNEPVLLEATGDIEIIGPKLISLKGGMGGTYVRSRSTVEGKGNGKLTVKNAQAGELSIDFRTEREFKWKNLK